jgi:hypothetical protein
LRQQHRSEDSKQGVVEGLIVHVRTIRAKSRTDKQQNITWYSYTSHRTNLILLTIKVGRKYLRCQTLKA